MAVFLIKPDISTLSRNNTVFGGFMPLNLLDILGIMEESQEKVRMGLGRRIRELRNEKGWTQQELGNYAEVNYKFIGEIERGRQNPSFDILVKIATALDVELPELFRFEHEILDRKEMEKRVDSIIKKIPDDALRQVLMLLRVTYPQH